MAKKKRRDWKNRIEPGGFIPLSHRFLASVVFRGLSAHAVKLLLDLASQYRGQNNGDLCAAWSVMAARGWKSRDTLAKALRELLDVEVAVISRRGNRRAPNLFALSFWPIDDCGGKLDISETQRPPSDWLQCEPVAPLKINGTPTPGVSHTAVMTRPAGDSNRRIVTYDTPTVQ